MSEITTRAEEGTDLANAAIARGCMSALESECRRLQSKVTVTESRAASAEAEVERLVGLVEDWKATADAEAEIGNERAATAQILRDRVAVLETALQSILKPFPAVTGPAEDMLEDWMSAVSRFRAAARAALNGGDHE